MKSFVHPHLWLYAILVSLSFSCSEEEDLLRNDATPIALDRAELKKLPNLIKVKPSKDMSGVTDADAIENALLTVRPGGTVLLAAGKYFIGRPVVAPGFNGILRGEDKKETRIFGVGSEASPFPLAPIQGDFGITDLAVLFHFPSPVGKVSVADLSVSLKEGFFSETIESGFVGPNDLFAFFVVDIGYDDVNTSFRNVALKGIAANPGGPFENLLRFQPSQGIVVHGLRDNFPFPISGGKHSVTHCHFNRIGLQSIVLQLLNHAQLEIRNNQLTEVKQIITRWLNGTNVAIENNHISSFSFGAIVVTQEFQPGGGDKNLVFIRRNTIHTDGFMGIEIGAASDFQTIIAHNYIEVGPDPTGFSANLTGIGLFQGQDKALVHNNTIRGTSEFAIALHGVSNSVVLHNDVSAHTSTANASYLLDADTFHNLVISKKAATFMDDGIDNRLIFLSALRSMPLDADISKTLRENNISVEEYMDFEQ